MTIKFIYPNPQQKEILDELEKINLVLSKPPSKELQKNMQFIKNFTYALLKTGRAHTIKKQPIKKPYEIHTKPLYVEPIKQMIVPPPPPPPSISVEKHPVQPSSIKLKREGGMLIYESIEPEMGNHDWKLLTKVKSAIKKQLLKNPNILEDENFLTQEIQKASEELKIKISSDYIKKIKYFLIKQIKGFGKIDPLMQDPKINSIICKYYDDISVIYGEEILKTNIKFKTNEELNNFIINLAEKFDKKISEDAPSLEFSTDQFKINLNYNPIMGSSFGIDKL